jgi:uncharacterized membrane protein
MNVLHSSIGTFVHVIMLVKKGAFVIGTTLILLNIVVSRWAQYYVCISQAAFIFGPTLLERILCTVRTTTCVVSSIALPHSICIYVPHNYKQLSRLSSEIKRK